MAERKKKKAWMYLENCIHTYLQSDAWIRLRRPAVYGRAGTDGATYRAKRGLTEREAGRKTSRRTGNNHDEECANNR